MTTTHAQMMPAASHRHAQLSNTRWSQAPDLRDSPAPLHPSQHLFYDDADTGEEVLEARVSPAHLLACGLFGGCGVSPPSSSEPCKPVSVARVACVGEALWASSAACLSGVRPAMVGPRSSTLLGVALPHSRCLSVGVFCWPLAGGCGHRASGGRGRRRSVPASAVAGAPARVRGRVARRRASRSGGCPKAATACGSPGRNGGSQEVAGGGRRCKGHACLVGRGVGCV
jgi:hypothetical protein